MTESSREVSRFIFKNEGICGMFEHEKEREEKGQATLGKVIQEEMAIKTGQGNMSRWQMGH